MFPMLEVLVGVFLIFTVASLMCSAAAELLEGFLKNRARDLERGVISLVGSREIGLAIRDHPLVRSLAKQEGDFPTHLPSRTFAIALLDLVARGLPRPEKSAEPEDFGARLKSLGKRVMGLIFLPPATPTEIKGEDRSQDVMTALTGSVEELLARIPDSALKRSLTGVLAFAKGQAQVEAAIHAGTGAPAQARAASEPDTTLTFAETAPQPAAGGAGAAARGARALATATPSRSAPNVVVGSGAGELGGGTGLVYTVAQALGAIEKWFDDGMDQVTAWYKRRSQFIIFAIGVVLAGWMNLDTIAIARTLATDPALRTTLIAEAEAASKADLPKQDGEPSKRFVAARQQLLSLGLPLGWSSTDDNRKPPSTAEGWAMKIIGLLVTALATSLGAPFWFDLLKRVMMVRAGLNPVEEPRKGGRTKKASS